MEWDKENFNGKENFHNKDLTNFCGLGIELF